MYSRPLCNFILNKYNQLLVPTGAGGAINCGCGWMQGLVGLDLRAGRGATMSHARFEVGVGPEALPSIALWILTRF